jgi:putative transposase
MTTQHRLVVGRKTSPFCLFPKGSSTSCLLHGDKKKKAVKRMLSDEPEHNPHPSRFALAKTIRLLLSADNSSLALAVATDMKSTFEQSAATYKPKMGMYTLDTGMCTLFGSDQGDLLGRNWMVKLERYDRLLQAIAKHRQQLGLKVASPRYRMIVASLRGYLKTEINRIFNRLVELKAPTGFVFEEPGFYLNPKLSRRLNRIMSNFGAGLITAKLKELEVRFGIIAEFVPPGDSSQTCSGCGYVDKKNRPKQDQFHCKFCNLKLHADVNAPRNLSARRSRASAQSSEQGFAARPHRRRILVETIRRFNERYTRQRVWPSDPRFNNPYYKDWAAKVRSPEIRTSPSSQGALG